MSDTAVEQVQKPEVPAEPAVETEVAEPVAESATAQDAEKANDQQPAEKKKDGNLQRRFNELTAKAQRAELEAQFWREKAQGTEKKPEVAGKPAENPKPKPEDYGTYDEYLDARDKWVRDDARREAAAEVEKRETQKRQQSEFQQVSEKFEKNIAATKEKYPDFDELAAQQPPVVATPIMQRAIITSPVSGELFYHFLKNPDEATRIARLDEIEQVRALAKIEARLEGESTAAAKKEEEPPPHPKAGKPPTPIRKATGSQEVDLDSPESDKLTDEEYFRRLKAKRR